jgi:hypothetical protein
MRFTARQQGNVWEVIDHDYKDRVAASCINADDAKAIASFFNLDYEGGRVILARLLAQFDYPN